VLQEIKWAPTPTSPRSRARTRSASPTCRPRGPLAYGRLTSVAVDPRVMDPPPDRRPCAAPREQAGRPCASCRTSRWHAPCPARASRHFASAPAGSAHKRKSPGCHQVVPSPPICASSEQNRSCTIRSAASTPPPPNSLSTPSRRASTRSTLPRAPKGVSHAPALTCRAVWLPAIGPRRTNYRSVIAGHRRSILRPPDRLKSNSRWTYITSPPFSGQAQPSPSRILAFPLAGRGQGLHCEVWGLSRARTQNLGTCL
jgi:hypothetical protein